MNISEIEKEIGERRVIRHQFKVFFNVYTQEEADHFYELGAVVRKAGGHEDPIYGIKEWGARCWEVFPVTMLDPMVEIVDEEEIDLAPQFILNHFRERDGYAGQLERILA